VTRGLIRSSGRLSDGSPYGLREKRGLQRALHIHETAHGPDYPYVATTLHNLAWMLLELGEPATARPLLQRALHVYERAFGPDHPRSVRIRETLGQLGDTSEGEVSSAAARCWAVHYTRGGFRLSGWRRGLGMVAILVAFAGGRPRTTALAV
jgi:Tetratricopeptide repeat